MSTYTDGMPEQNAALIKKLSDEDPRFDVLMVLLWDALKPPENYSENYSDRRDTGWGSKTKVGLFLSVKNVMCSPDFQPTHNDSSRAGA